MEANKRTYSGISAKSYISKLVKLSEFIFTKKIGLELNFSKLESTESNNRNDMFSPSLCIETNWQQEKSDWIW